MNSTGKSETVVVLGATTKEDRYANMAQKLLKEHGHRPIPVNPAFAEILGEKCYAGIADVPGPIDTVTMYLGEARSTPLIADILAAKPRRIIFNPGAENAHLAREAQARGIEALEACTLVMLRTGQY
ncbi:CoA-binding protein [Verrucomicrobiaceae bacterium SCGC AG-212-N21]|nr:CoA-binding protein [Verrucomicrobiaceae bacterium SCGC AG-212-N21]